LFSQRLGGVLDRNDHTQFDQVATV
jgi:hypothetical protein